MPSFDDKFKVKSIFFILSFLLSYKVLAHGPSFLFSDLQELNQTINAPIINSCRESQAFEKALFVRGQDDHQNAFNCSDVTDFTNMRALSAWRYCRPRFGASAQPCFEKDSQIIQKRLSDQELMNEVTNFTQTTFDNYKLELANKCCSPEQKNCLNRFEKLKLTIKNDTSSSAQYVSDSAPVNFHYNEIEITHGKLAAEYTKEGIERVLLHEFGHVCQFALISEDEAKYKEFTSPTTRCLESTGINGFKVTDLKSLPCVQKKLEALAKTHSDTSKFCHGKWYREAFADMIFRDKMNTIYHWIYDMHRTSPSKNYGSVFDYIQCDLESFPYTKTCN